MEDGAIMTSIIYVLLSFRPQNIKVDHAKFKTIKNKNFINFIRIAQEIHDQNLFIFNFGTNIFQNTQYKYYIIDKNRNL